MLSYSGGKKHVPPASYSLLKVVDGVELVPSNRELSHTIQRSLQAGAHPEGGFESVHVSVRVKRCWAVSAKVQLSPFYGAYGSRVGTRLPDAVRTIMFRSSPALPCPGCTCGLPTSFLMDLVAC